MRREFKLPDVGEGLTEAEIVRWHVQPGDEVKVNQIVVEIETAKSIVELPIPWHGVVADLLADEGVTVEVGLPIIAVETGEPAPDVPVERRALAEDLVPSPPAEGAVEPGAHGSPAPKEERQAVLVGYGVKTGATRRRPRKTPTPATIPAPPVANPDRTELPGTPRKAKSVQELRTGRRHEGATGRLSRHPAVRLSRRRGGEQRYGGGRRNAYGREPYSGPGQTAGTQTGQGPRRRPRHHHRNRPPRLHHPRGRPRRHRPGGTAAPGAARRATVQALEERIPVKGVRKMTAQAMVTSAFTAPHVTEFLQVDATATMEAVKRLRTLPEFADVKVSPLLLVAKAVLTAAKRHPMINSAWDEAAQEIVVKHYVNLGIAAATPRGLVVPNIKNAHQLSLPDLAEHLARLAETARAGRTQPPEMAGGTITITNVGVFGVDAGTPILNPGETAVLAFGQIRDQPWVVDGQLAVRKVTTLSLSFDHRVVDGELGSLFLRDVGAMLEDPLRVLAWT